MFDNGARLEILDKDKPMAFTEYAPYNFLTYKQWQDSGKMGPRSIGNIKQRWLTIEPDQVLPRTRDGYRNQLLDFWTRKSRSASDTQGYGYIPFDLLKELYSDQVGRGMYAELFYWKYYQEQQPGVIIPTSFLVDFKFGCDFVVMPDLHPIFAGYLRSPQVVSACLYDVCIDSPNGRFGKEKRQKPINDRYRFRLLEENGTPYQFSLAHTPVSPLFLTGVYDLLGRYVANDLEIDDVVDTYSKIQRRTANYEPKEMTERGSWGKSDRTYFIL